jgi:hypothetical protein
MPTRPKKVKVIDKPELVRDTFSKAIINTDRSNYAAARARKKMLVSKEETVKSLQNDIADLRKDYEALLKMVSSITKTPR